MDNHLTTLNYDNKSFCKIASICPDPIIGIDQKGMITLFNKSAESLLGYTMSDFSTGITIVDLYGSREEASKVNRLLHSNSQGITGQIEGYETHLVTIDGKRIPIRLSAAIMFEDGKEVGSIGFFHDVGEAKLAEAKLRKLSITDELTGLYNRRHFNDSMSEQMKRSSRYNRPLSLICIDIDNFKAVNDLMGHQEGDSAIKSIASILATTLRGTDMAFRFGGDEFTALLPEATLAKASILAQRILDSGKIQINKPHSSTVINLSLSIGIAEFDMKESPELFLKRADRAMYDAKGSGGNQIVVNPTF